MKIKDKTLKPMEYLDAPSGFVKLYNYKEPFMPFEGGFGFMGALLFDGKTDLIQCHFCGMWFNDLSHHLHREHSMTANVYKEKVGLLKSSALLSEGARAKLIRDPLALAKRMENLRVQGKKSEETKEKISKTLKENRLEIKNIRGCCPAQLLDRLQRLQEKLGRTPYTDEIGFKDSLRLVFGSTTEALRLAGIERRPPGSSNGHSRSAWSEEDREKSREELIQSLKDFSSYHGRNPAPTDAKRGLLPARYRKYYLTFGRWEFVLKAANLL